MGSRGNRKLQLIILLVLVSLVGTMSIAYAVLSTTLNINGTAQVQDASWNVHFDNVQVNPYSVPINPVITDNNKITFSADLTTPGDFYKFTVDIVNEGSIGAKIESIAKIPELTTEQKKYLRYEVEYVDGTSINESQLLKSGETKTISILFSYRNDIPTSNLPTTETEFDLEIVLVYVQADNTGVEISGDEKLVKVVSGDLTTVGSEICIEEECFYLMKNNGKYITMLAKYNLNAGGWSENGIWTSYGTDITYIQDENMLGLAGKERKNGVIKFSENQYWHENTIKKEYGTNYPAYIYDNNSTLYNYIENYKKYLTEHSVIINNARLITYDELIELGCTRENNTTCLESNNKWIYATSYWSGSAGTPTLIWFVDKFGYFNHRIYSYEHEYGICPVIEIPLTEF